MENDKLFDLMGKIYSEMQNGFNRVDSRLDNLETDMKEVKGDIKRLYAKIDGEITPKIGSLFDGYKANSEKLEELNDKIDSLQMDVNSLSIKVASNDNKIIEMKRTLKSV